MLSILDEVLNDEDGYEFSVPEKFKCIDKKTQEVKYLINEIDAKTLFYDYSKSKFALDTIDKKEHVSNMLDIFEDFLTDLNKFSYKNGVNVEVNLFGGKFKICYKTFDSKKYNTENLKGVKNVDLSSKDVKYSVLKFSFGKRKKECIKKDQL